jgi:glyoxylase-like metal-dependent hydrolase (beta-lactamase superfamily II)
MSPAAWRVSTAQISARRLFLTPWAEERTCQKLGTSGHRNNSSGKSIVHKFIILQVIPLASWDEATANRLTSFTLVVRRVTLSVVQTINLIELNWLGHPRSIAANLMLAGEQRFLVDPGPASTLPTLTAELAALGVKIPDLDAILLTHIHLDHAGATGSLVRQNPRMKVFVHAKGAPHMVDPSKLLGSAVRLYGDKMETMYGAFLPVPRDNLQVLNGGETLRFGKRELRVLYTPGHASHHVTYFDTTDGVAFVGDNTGICVKGNPFILPATPPPDINLELWNASLDAIAALHPHRLFLTHFGFSDDPARHIESYRQCLAHWGELVRTLLSTNKDEADAMKAFSNAVYKDAAQTLSAEEADHYVFNGALDLSWMGLARYHRKRATSAAQG